MAAAERLGFNEERRSDIGIVATEAATNAILHAQTGDFLLCEGEGPDAAWLDLLTLDSGAGIRDISAARRDGFSSGGTAGHGLGAITRQSDETAIYSQSERGTANWSRFYLDPAGPRNDRYGAVNIPVRGETECGDGFLVIEGATSTLYMVVDGLGHGPQAAEAAREAVMVTQQHAARPAQEIVLFAHDALRKTRGAAMSVAIAHHDRGVISYAGVGNISAVLQRDAQMRSLVSQNGTLGAVLPRQVQEYQYPFEPGNLLLMFSDGLSSKTSISGYAGLQNRHPQLVAGVLFRDFSRKRDDATVLVACLDGPRS
jgi:anti-sigma regulatory factor (Ser/Thr protein kinase)